MSKCEECHKEFTGRSDKKFCSDQCRSTFHNRKYASDDQYIRKTNRILKKNRHILLDLYRIHDNGIEVAALQELGFNFRYFTSTRTTEQGQTFKYCYEIGYCETGKQTFKLMLKT